MLTVTAWITSLIGSPEAEGSAKATLFETAKSSQEEATAETALRLNRRSRHPRGSVESVCSDLQCSVSVSQI